LHPSLLEAVVIEVGARLLEQELQRVSCLGGFRYVLRFATPAHDNLLLSVRTDLPRLHLLPRPGRLAETVLDPFAGSLDRVLGGSILTGIEKAPADRRVEMRFRATEESGAGTVARLVVELLGRRANALLLDAAGIVVALAHQAPENARSARLGALYLPPQPPE
jgi:predicted ribosome quality control (RQC) complex YloA/Tae2 family protein